jgi:hypothetical protein
MSGTSARAQRQRQQYHDGVVEGVMWTWVLMLTMTSLKKGLQRPLGSENFGLG